jgi:hypothetical protein
MRLAYIIAGLFLAGNAIFIGLRLYEGHSTLILVAVAPALLGAVALGALLIVRNVKPPPPEPIEEAIGESSETNETNELGEENRPE